MPGIKGSGGKAGRSGDKHGHPKRGNAGRKPRILTLDLGKDTLATLRLLAAAQNTTVEALAAGWVRERAAREWEEYSTQVSCLLEEWKEEIL